jgi:hypothetical protein
MAIARRVISTGSLDCPESERDTGVETVSAALEPESISFLFDIRQFTIENVEISTAKMKSVDLFPRARLIAFIGKAARRLWPERLTLCLRQFGYYVPYNQQSSSDGGVRALANSPVFNVSCNV